MDDQPTGATLLRHVWESIGKVAESSATIDTVRDLMAEYPLTVAKEFAAKLADQTIDNRVRERLVNIVRRVGNGCEIAPWMRSVMRDALTHPDIDVRDSAAMAADTWGDDEMIEIARAHAPVETVEWLKGYIDDVVSYHDRVYGCGDAR